MKKEQYIVTGGDESYTYPSLIEPILEYIEKFRLDKDIPRAEFKIWLPFDLKEDTKFTTENGEIIKVLQSNYYNILKEFGYNVIVSHLATGQDFFKYEPDNYDLIVSNPPFKNKRLFFERVLSLEKPFALVNTASWLNDGGLFDIFKGKQMQLLMPKSRSKFFNENGSIGSSPSFKAIYFCYDFLQEGDIQWFELNKDLDNK